MVNRLTGESEETANRLIGQVVPAADSRPNVLSPSALIEQQIQMALQGRQGTRGNPVAERRALNASAPWGPVIEPWADAGRTVEELSPITHGLRSLPGMLLPLERNAATGDVRLAIPSIVPATLQGIHDLIATPYRVATNEGGINDVYYDEATGRTFRPGVEEAASNMALGLMGGVGVTAPIRSPGLGIFGGVRSRTANLKNLETAQIMETYGVPADDIWRETGWGRGPDGQWRYEIDDSAMTVNPAGVPTGSGSLTTLTGHAISHPELFQAYPDLGTMPLTRSEAPTGGGSATIYGAYNRPFANNPESIDVTAPIEGHRNILMHELQHAVQQREGFPGGYYPGSPVTPDIQQGLRAEWNQRISDIMAEQEQYVRDRFFAIPPEERRALSLDALSQLGDRAREEWFATNPEAVAELGAIRQRVNDLYSDPGNYIYDRAMGEVEARNVQARGNMSEAERLATPPWQTATVDPAEQVNVSPYIDAFLSNYGTPDDFFPEEATRSPMFAGAKAQTADLDALSRAIDMEQQGLDRRAIWDATGWFHGPDGQWRFEIDDSGSTLATPKRIPGIRTSTLGPSSPSASWAMPPGPFSHPALFEAYPDIGDIHLSRTTRRHPQAAGFYGGEAPETIELFGQSPRHRSTLLHEIQHAIQAREGFDPGANPEMEGMVDIGYESRRQIRQYLLQLDAERDAFVAEFVARMSQTMPDLTPELREALVSVGRHEWAKTQNWREILPLQRLVDDLSLADAAYWVNMGEAEARNVQSRMDMTQQERMASPPWETLDYPERFFTAAPDRLSRPGFPAEVTRSASIRAYHGSPHDFDRFDLSKIGTGEGAQAYGHGLYLAEREGIAESYRRNLTAARSEIQLLNGSGLSREAKDLFDNIVREHGRNLDREDFDRILREKWGDVDDPSPLVELEDALREGGIQFHTPEGTVYEVDVDAEPEQLLDLDLPLTLQSPQVQAAIARLGQDVNASDGLSAFAAPSPQTGMNFYNRLASEMGPAAASQALREAGVPGARYFDQGSRRPGVMFDGGPVPNDGSAAAGAAGVLRDTGSIPRAIQTLETMVRPGDPGYDLAQEAIALLRSGRVDFDSPRSRNIVVYDDALIEILRKYGLLGPTIGAGAALGGMFGGGPATPASQAPATPGNRFFA